MKRILLSLVFFSLISSWFTYPVSVIASNGVCDSGQNKTIVDIKTDVPLVSDKSIVEAERSFDLQLVPGSYRVFAAYKDDHSTQSNPSQDAERWSFALEDGDGNLIAESPATKDLDDRDDYQEELLADNFIVSREPRSVLVRHAAFSGVPTDDANSIWPVCLVFEAVSRSGNTAPEFVDFNPPRQAEPFREYSYDVAAYDADNDDFKFGLINPPEGMQIDSVSGVITWLPTTKQALLSPVQSVAVFVKDSRGNVGEASFDVTMMLNSGIKASDSMCAAKTGRSVALFDGYIRSDRDEAAHELAPVPLSVTPGVYRVLYASYDNHSQKLTPGVPDDQVEESFYAVLVGNGTTTETAETPDIPDDADYIEGVLYEAFYLPFDLTSVQPRHASYPNAIPNSVDPVCLAFESQTPAANIAPRFAGPSLITTTVGSSTGFDVFAYDPNGDPLTVTTTVPVGATSTVLRTATGTLVSVAWVPYATGTFEARFEASDGATSSLFTVSIVVLSSGSSGDENLPPVFAGPTSAEGVVSTSISFLLLVFDPDADTLTVTSTLPNGAVSSIITAGITSTISFSWIPNATGTYSARFEASDGVTSTRHDVVIRVFEPGGEANRAPVFYGVTSASGTISSSLSFALQVSDPDFDLLAISSTLPEGATTSVALSGATSTIVFSWVPNATGTFSARFYAADAVTTTEHVVYLVIFGTSTSGGGGGGGNRAPVWSGVTSTEVKIGSVLFLDLYAYDPEGGVLVVTSTLPGEATSSFAVYGTTTRVFFEWMPSATGTYAASFTASDGFLASTHDVSIAVLASTTVNHAPVWRGLTEATTTISSTLEVILRAADQDGDLLVISSTLPNGATSTVTSVLSSSTVVFLYVPQATGTYFANFSAFDGIVSTPHVLEITVATSSAGSGGGGGSGNRAPVWSGPDSATTTVSTTLVFGVSVADLDQDVLIVSSVLPDGATYSSVTNLFTWTPTATGTFSAVFQAFDGFVTSTKNVRVFVYPTGVSDFPPFFTKVPTSQTLKAQDSYISDADAVDPEGTNVTFLLSGAPSGMAVSSSTGEITWTPNDNQLGEHVIGLIAVDAVGSIATTSFVLTVQARQSGGGGSGGGGGGGSGGGSGGGGGGGNPPSCIYTNSCGSGGGSPSNDDIPAGGVLPVIRPSTPIVSIAPIRGDSGLDGVVGDNSGAVVNAGSLPESVVVGSTSTESSTLVTTVTPAKSRSLFGLLLASVGNLMDWLTGACGNNLLLLLWLITLAAFVAYVVTDRKRHSKEVVSGVRSTSSIANSGAVLPGDVGKN